MAIVSGKKILIFIPSLSGGGAERVACRLATELSKNNSVFLMYYIHTKQEYYVGPGVHKVEVRLWPGIRVRRRIGRIGRWYEVFCLAAVMSLVRLKHEIDTTVSFMDYLNFINVFAPGHCRKIISDRNDPDNKTADSKRESLYAHKHTDFAVFQTHKAQDIYGANIKKKSCIIPNPTEVSCFVSPHRNKKIAAVGRLNKQKNHKLLIEAFALFHSIHREYHLHIYGQGELLAELKQTAAERNINDFIHFEGFKADVHREIADAEQFVLSSDYEGLSNALMEAMMMGHCCISTACTGSDELIEDGNNGLLVPVGNAKALSAAMCRLSDNPQLRERLARNAAATAQTWKTEHIAGLWERIL